MRPIKLKIKGLNSFIETQEIDFHKLMYRGLFGIFGPTGSGKSTILDGITLALYGEVARKSSNFINTNCSNLYVSFEFQISAKEINIYRVDREYRRDKEGRIRTKSARILDITCGEEILEEGVKSVNKKCEEIIGLQLDDFTRTVVLPQGKFSEFLTLSGKERRDMLERLFNLQKYGNELSSKLSREVSSQKQKFNVLQGELKGYDNINVDILKNKTEQFSIIKEQCSEYEKQLAEIEVKFNEGKELMDLQNDLKHKLVEQDSLEKNKAKIESYKNKILLCESALKVKPYVDNYESTVQKIKSVKNEIMHLEDEMKKVEENRALVYKFLTEAKADNDNKLPELRLQYQKIVDAIQERDILNRVICENNSIKESIVKLSDNIDTFKYEIENNGKYIESIYNSISLKEKKCDELETSEQYKRKVNEAIVILSNYENLIKQRDVLCGKIKSTVYIIESNERESKVLFNDLNEKKHLLQEKEDMLDELLKNCPGDQNMLLELQKKISSTDDKWTQYNSITYNIKNSSNIIEDFKEKLNQDNKKIEELEKHISNRNGEIESIHVENLAQTLRSKLIEGEPCPVCGSVHHIGQNIKTTDTHNLKQLKLDLDKKKKDYELLTARIIKIKANIDGEIKNIEKNNEQLEQLGEEFKSVSVDELKHQFRLLRDNIEKFNSEKNSLESQIKILTENKNKLEIGYSKMFAVQEQNKSQLVNLKTELEKLENEYKGLYDILSNMKTELKVHDFKQKNMEIYEREKKRISIENRLKDLRVALKKNQNQREILKGKFTDLREKLNENKVRFIENEKIIHEKKTSIKAKLENSENMEQLESVKESILRRIEQIKDTYIRTEKQKNDIDTKYNECNSNLVASQKNLLNLKERNTQERISLENILKEQNINNIDEVKNNIADVLEIKKLKSEVEEYNRLSAKLAGTLEDINKKIGSRKITQEQWDEIKKSRNEKNKIFEELKNTRIKLEDEIKYISDKLNELNILSKSKQKLNHKLSILDDLDKLFKGKKFVEFVAANQLKYISIEASKRLRHITCGKYGLEVDDEGKFLIIDYKNGGEKRDASTLSGGEVFVTSLALALALSSRIQLKGTAPLELFFLDEGFGTLDDNLLEIVMDSLEKIHNKRLSIGIISHLESIKDRVPVKLVVTPAEAGIGGSRVKIE
ncbi:AAA family ATPase [Clostridium tyrobutyricum]|uniref:AAA family ATPase n=1 Tax=Clostridium tyrobutyricum TaxID=1519 RepID=UPI00057C7077|nr:AAA family ATPase [Clostridium tyrobutyricum]MBV4447695.1 AAA family ATPase [Clostridium tyrobutyricum]